MKKLSVKQRLIALSATALLGALVMGSSIAYFTAKDTARNVITTGSVAIKLHETMINEDGETVPFEDAIGVMPGDQVSKIVEVENTGGQDAWIRVSVEKEIQLAEGVSGEPDTSLVTFDLNEEDWTEQDGYYYYNKKLSAGEKTEPLFTQVSFAKEMGNLYQDSKAIVNVEAYATQVANNGDTVFEAAGWPDAQ